MSAFIMDRMWLKRNAGAAYVITSIQLGFNDANRVSDQLQIPGAGIFSYILSNFNTAGILPRHIRFCINRGRIKNIYIYNSEVAAADMASTYSTQGWINTEYEVDEFGIETRNADGAICDPSASDEGYTEWQTIDYDSGKTIVGMRMNLDTYIFNFNFVLGEAYDAVSDTSTLLSPLNSWTAPLPYYTNGEPT